MRAAAAAILVALAVVAGSGCGGEEPRGDARKGGSITVGTSSLPRVLDPALATDQLALQALWAVYTPPVSYRHAEGRDGAELIPGLARRLPEVSEDGLTYSFRFRGGLRYSGGARLRASDFERAVDRARRLDSPYAELYAGIGAIDADDRSGRVVVTLKGPDPTFEHVLALPASAPAPAGTATADLSSDPPPGIGPYRIAGVRPGERWVLQRARGFELPDLPGGNVDEVTIERFGAAARQAETVATGTGLDLMQELPPIAQLPEVRSKYDDRYEEQPTASALFFAIDPATPGFEDRRVRQAISLAVDRPTLERLYAGRLDASCNILPSSMPGYRRLDPCPYGDPGDPPDLVRARELVEDAGQAGTAVSVGAALGAAPPAVPRYFAATLRKIGLAARLQRGPGRADVTLELLAPPMAHPAAFLGWFQGRTGDFEVEAELERLLGEPEPDDGDWADVDESLVEEAYAAPLGSQKLPAFFSERIDVEACVLFHPVFGTDLANLCLR